VSERPLVCIHGALRRSCDACDAADECERLERVVDELAAALRRYRNEVPLGPQQHMLEYEVDVLLARIDAEKQG